MYIDIWHDRKYDVMRVSERINGKRVIKEYEPSYFFYYSDPRGKFKSFTGVKCSKFETKKYEEFKQQLAIYRNSGRITFEGDVKPIFKTLEKYYKNNKLEKPNVTFFDIETDFDKERGYAPPSDPFNRITAITLYNDWQGLLYTLALKPNTLTEKEAENIISDFENSVVCDDETEMLTIFLQLIQDSDILSGWNSESYDIPYIVNRIRMVLGNNAARDLCLFNAFPIKREFDNYGEVQETFDLIGRIHLDYLKLYEKYTYSQLHSYSLDNVAEHELKERKVKYEGSLDKLYNQDFKKFIEYSRQDVAILHKLDKKLDFISLIFQIANSCLVPINAAFGSVLMLDNAVVLEAHRMGLVSVERKESNDNLDEHKIAGAFVLDPPKGIVDWVASVDINSLYPSTFRALNMSPETLVGQIRHIETEELLESRKKEFVTRKVSNAEIWKNIFNIIEVEYVINKTDDDLIVDFNDNTSVKLKAHELKKLILDKKWILSANGTIFRSDIKGVVPSLLETWYNERKAMQAKVKEFIEKLDAVSDISEKRKIQEQIEYWDKQQLVRKINLNSIYGSLTNMGSRYFDQRIGQSCTLTGRCITKHMGCEISKTICDVYDITEYTKYFDTDSCYFTILGKNDEHSDIDKDSFVVIADEIAQHVNSTFPTFLNKNYNVPIENGKVIKCSREICASRMLFAKKKKYAALIYDKEGKRLDRDGTTGSLKIMGIESQRSDTPEWIQEKLTEAIRLVLETNDFDLFTESVREWRTEFSKKPAWEKGVPKRVNNLSEYRRKYKAGIKVTIPGHVQASLNYNNLLDIYNDKESMKITDGMKIITCKLKKNAYNFNSIAFPVDIVMIPEWFKKLPFNDEEMVDIVIDKKIENIFGCLDWDLSKIKQNKLIARLKWS